MLITARGDFRGKISPEVPGYGYLFLCLASDCVTLGVERRKKRPGPGRFTTHMHVSLFCRVADSCREEPIDLIFTELPASGD